MDRIKPLLGALLGALAVTLAVMAAAANADAAGRCTHVVQKGGSEYLVNTCDACQVVNIQRKRQGVAMPIMRTYNVRARSRFETPFKGNGASRISSEVPCEGEQGAGVNVMDPKDAKPAARQCVALKATGAGGVVLVNSCSSCRGVAVERYAANGKSMGREAFKMNPLGVVQVPPKGAARVGYLADVACSS
ncbi:MAG: hypothetical protein VW405_06275 [Rhodospirillaceae bacterium]